MKKLLSILLFLSFTLVGCLQPRFTISLAKEDQTIDNVEFKFEKSIEDGRIYVVDITPIPDTQTQENTVTWEIHKESRKNKIRSLTYGEKPTGYSSKNNRLSEDDTLIPLQENHSYCLNVEDRKREGLFKFSVDADGVVSAIPLKEGENGYGDSCPF